MIKLALRTTTEALRDLWDEMFLLALCNLLWTLSIVPIVTLPAATGALFYLTHEITEGKAVAFSDFKHGFRAYFRQSLLLSLLNLLIAVVLFVNYVFYNRYSGVLFRFIQIVYIYLFGVWLLMQLYLFPLLLEQEEPSIRTAGRNAVVLILKHPLYSLVIGIMASSIVALSFILTLPVVVLLASALALLGNHAVRSLLALHAETSE